MRCLKMILPWVIALAVTASAGDLKNYQVSVHVSAPGSSASGSLSAEEGRKGKIVITSGRKGKAVGITISGMAEGAKNVELIDDDSRNILSGDEALTATIYFKAISVGGDRVKVVGVLNQKTLVEDGEFPRFSYEESPLEFTVRADGKDSHLLSLEAPPNEFKLTLTVTDIGVTVSRKPKPHRAASIKAEYSLYNEDEGKYELRESDCRFRLSYDSDENVSSCTKKLFFNSDDDKTLLYLARVRIENLQCEGDRMEFTLSVNRMCGDAVGYVESEDGLRATFNTATMRRQEKPLSGRVGDVYEIELDEFPGSGLPFRARESIRLTF